MEDNDVKLAFEVIDEPLEMQVERDYANYARYTIQERALPSIDDGMKPVQRKILYSMFSNNLTPTKGHTKSARIVGDTMGKYHPHGDVGIYDALVRLAQPHVFSCYPIDGQGNMGGPGISAAASRYTEARLSPYGMLMTEELNDNVVDTVPNYDETLTVPVNLPVQVPVLLINGSSGIAVAMACSFSPHNPREALRASIYQLEHQDLWTAITGAQNDVQRAEAVDKAVEEPTQVIPGPDFPTGGHIYGVEGAHEAYKTGSGKIVMRASYRIEDLGRGKHRIVFYETPYGVAASNIVSFLQENEKKFLRSQRILKENGGKGKLEGFQIEGITSIGDFSDADAELNLVIDLDAKINPEIVVAELFKRTQLETSFNFNQNCLINGIPRVVTLPEMLQHFLNFRRSIVRRRAENVRSKAQKRLNTVEGLRAILIDIDKAIRIIRESDTPEIASVGLQEAFSVNEEQAQSILNTALRRLTRLDSLTLDQEYESLTAQIAEQTSIIESKTVRDAIVKKELEAILEDFEKDESTARKSQIQGMSLKEHAQLQKETLAQSREVQDEPVELFLSYDGHVTRKPTQYASQKLGATTLGNVVALLNTGRGLRVPVQDLSVLKLREGEKIILLSDEAQDIVVGTKQGIAYAFKPSFPSKANDFEFIQLSDGDEVIGGSTVDEDGEIVFVASDSSLLHYPSSSVAVKASINGKGMAGMKLADDAQVIAFKQLNAKEKMLAKVATSTGESVKLSSFAEFPSKGRGTGGVRSHRFLKGETSLNHAAIGVNPQFLDEENNPFVPEDSRRDGSGEKFSAHSIRATLI